MRISLLQVMAGMIPLLVGVSARSAWAVQVRAGEKLVIGPDQVVNESLLVTGGRVRIDGQVMGDVFCAGGDISVNGTIDGSLTVAGGQIALKGSLRRTLWAAGGNISIEGPIQGDAVVAGGNVKLGQNGAIERDLAVWSGNVELAGRVGGRVSGSAGSLDISGKVGRDVETRVRKLTVRSNSVIGGDISYQSADDAAIEEGAAVGGQVIRRPPSKSMKSWPASSSWGTSLVVEFLFLAAAVVLGSVLIVLAPRQATKTAAKIGVSPWKSLGMGFVFLAAAAAVAALAFLTVVGIPIALSLIFFCCFLLYVSKIFTGLFLGRRILAKWSGEGGAWLIASMALGLLILFLASGIPFIGWLIYLVAVLLGLGAILAAQSQLWQEWRRKGIL